MKEQIMHDRQFESELEQRIAIEEVLEEARRWNLEEEVESWAQKTIHEDPTVDILEAYYAAFNEWVK